MEWHQFKLWYGDSPGPEKLYTFRKSLFPILEQHAIENFLVLNEPEALYFRIETKFGNLKEIEEKLNTLVSQSGKLFSKVTHEKWSPEEDARARILAAAQRLGLRVEEGKGWKIVGRDPLNHLWIPTVDELDLKTNEFATFMSSVLGKFTRTYVEQMPRYVDDRWLLSVLVHLILDSISINQFQEQDVREFPFV